MSKRRKSAGDIFSIESLREEAEGEVNQEVIAAKILKDIGSINLNLADSVSVDVILCALIVKFGLSVVCSLAHVVPSLFVLPVNVCCEVLKLLCPQLPEKEASTLFQCLLKLKRSNLTAGSTAAHFHVFTPPCGRCIECNSSLVRHNNPVKVQYHHLNGTSEGIKVSLKCNKCNTLYGYSKFGNTKAGWKLYPECRTAVEASDVCFVERSLLKWQISLA
jgi:hypothetical protein